MERHGEIVRQWRILMALEGATRGLTLADIQEAAADDVSSRTIRRDLTALAQAGFPVENHKTADGVRFTLNREVFGGLASAGLSLSELCALYLSRQLLAALAGGPFHDSLTSAFDKITDALPPALWRFVDHLPSALTAKAPALRAPAATPRLLDTVMSAILSHRRVRMRYHSFASAQVKDYLVEPYRLAYAQGTLYLFAFVPAYGEMRTFAVQRITSLTMTEEAFDPRDAGHGPAFPDSLSAFSGTPAHVVVEFTAAEAPYIREREWHPTQTLSDRPDGGVTLALDVVVDWGLEAWLLGFGAAARVTAPPELAERLRHRLEAAIDRYRS
ncbi:MAG: WYL domain-containing transcriptional regulator [Acidobacteria bacterium]|nr:WYL domain-containing transcriptional regulator [Acidobacteriota bacterium]